MNIGTLNGKPAEVNGTKTKSLRTGRRTPRRQQKSRERNASLLGSRFVYIGVLSNDFAAVDLREELCYHSRPRKSANSEGLMLLLECKKSGVISLGGLHPYLPQIYRIWLKNDLKITF